MPTRPTPMYSAFYIKRPLCLLALVVLTILGTILIYNFCVFSIALYSGNEEPSPADERTAKQDSDSMYHIQSSESRTSSCDAGCDDGSKSSKNQLSTNSSTQNGRKQPSKQDKGYNKHSARADNTRLPKEKRLGSIMFLEVLNKIIRTRGKNINTNKMMCKIQLIYTALHFILSMEGVQLMLKNTYCLDKKFAGTFLNMIQGDGAVCVSARNLYECSETYFAQREKTLVTHTSRKSFKRYLICLIRLLNDKFYFNYTINHRGQFVPSHEIFRIEYEITAEYRNGRCSTHGFHQNTTIEMLYLTKNMIEIDNEKSRVYRTLLKNPELKMIQLDITHYPTYLLLDTKANVYCFFKCLARCKYYRFTTVLRNSKYLLKSLVLISHNRSIRLYTIKDDGAYRCKNNRVTRMKKENRNRLTKFYKVRQIISIFERI